MELIPAILVKTFTEFEDRLADVAGVAPLVQVDVVDGLFAPNKTWPYTDKESFLPFTEEEEGLPFWDEVNIEVDLMTHTAKKDAEAWIRAGASRLVVHVESGDAKETLEMLESLKTDLSPEIGIALSPQTPLSALAPYAGTYTYIQIMGIEKPGFQAQDAWGGTADRIRECKTMYPDTPIQIDGGVNTDTMRLYKEAGATRLVIGSAFWNGDIRKNLSHFKKLLAS